MNVSGSRYAQPELGLDELCDINDRHLTDTEQRDFDRLVGDADTDGSIGSLEARLRAAEASEQAKARAQTVWARGAGGDELRANDEPRSRPVSRDAGGPRWIRTNDRRTATVARGQRFAEQEIVADYAASRAAADQHVIGQHGSLGQMIRAMTTTSGAAVVPTVWAGDIIDRARNLAAVLRAGAEIVPMDAKTVQIRRLTTDPVAAFRTEGSTITPSDPVFDNVTLDSKTMSSLVVGSLEWFQDADNVDSLVTDALARGFAVELDKQALFGGVTTGAEVSASGFNQTFPTPPNPRGVLATLLAVASSSVIGHLALTAPRRLRRPISRSCSTRFTRLAISTKRQCAYRECEAIPAVRRRRGYD